MTQTTGIIGGIISGYPFDIKKREYVSLNELGNIIKANGKIYGTMSGMTWVDDGIPQSSDNWVAGTTYDENNPRYVWVELQRGD